MKQAGEYEAKGARFLLALGVLIFAVEPLSAQSHTTVGGMFCEVFKNAGGITTFTSAIAYLTGGWLGIRGIFDLIKRSSDPNHPLRNGLLGLMAGAMVASMPHLVTWLQNTIYGEGNLKYASPACNPNAGTNPASGPVPLDIMLQNFVNNINAPIIALISAMSIILGAIMIFYNMVKLSKFGSDAQTNKLTPILGSLVIGAILMAFGHSVDVSLNTLFSTVGGTGSLVRYDSIAYDIPGITRFNTAMNAVFIFLYIIGALSFTRGFFILKNAMEGQGQATKGQAFTHIISGTLLINMPGFIEALEQTIGFDIINSRAWPI